MAAILGEGRFVLREGFPVGAPCNFFLFHFIRFKSFKFFLRSYQRWRLFLVLLSPWNVSLLRVMVSAIIWRPRDFTIEISDVTLDMSVTIDVVDVTNSIGFCVICDIIN